MTTSLKAARAEFVIASCPAQCSGIQDHIVAELKASGFTQRELFGVRLALEEALVNAMKHGNAGDRAKEIRVAFEIDDEELVLCVEDEGSGFRPNEVPDPTLPENLDRPNGRGILLMRTFMTHVAYNARGNRVTLQLLR